MMVLWEKKEILVKDIGGKLFLDSGTLTPVLNGLEKKGYARRKRSEKDKRDVYVVLTEQKELLRDKAVGIPQKVGACVPLESKKALELYHILHEMLEKL